MLFRERRVDQLEPRRFRDDLVPYAMHPEGGRWRALVSPGAELAVELLIELAAHVGSPVEVTLDDRRGGAAWTRREVPLGDVRDALVRLRPALARYGGVGVRLEADGEVAMLSPLLTLEFDAPTDRWRYLLEGQGLVARPAVPPKAWRKPGAPWAPVPELAEAVADAASRLGLSRVPA